MFKSLGSRLRGLLAKQRLGLSWAEWLVALLAVLVLAAIVYGTAADIRRQGLSREALAQAKAARLLGLSRPTLIAKIEKYGLRIEAQARIEG